MRSKNNTSRKIESRIIKNEDKEKDSRKINLKNTTESPDPQSLTELKRMTKIKIYRMNKTLDKEIVSKDKEFNKDLENRIETIESHLCTELKRFLLLEKRM